jgi:enediyne biosynthesis protein E4
MTAPDQRPSPSEPDELAPLDDAVIGRAFRWSFIAFVALLMAGGGLYLALKPKARTAETRVTRLSAPTVPQKPVAEVPAAKFTDITGAAGIAFVHRNGAYGDKLLPETMGGGVAFLDFDNDGAPDLLFVNSTVWPWKAIPGEKLPTLTLYRNDGRGRFTDVTAGSGLDVSLYGMGVAVGDYDNDGRVDVFITAVGGNRLFHSESGGKFRDVTAEAGVGGSTNDWSTCAAWIDYDNDGRLDLFVGNYIRWSREIDFEVDYKLVGLGRAYGQPNNFEGAFPHLFHNEGRGRFTDVSERSGVQVRNPATGVPAAKTLGVAPVDLDGDGWIDLIVANDTVQNFVFLNQHNGTFKEVGALAGLAFDTYGNTRGAMGIDTGCFRNDAKLGIAIGNFANEMTALYVAQNAPTNFADEAITEGVGPASRLLLKFGVLFFDYDLDGWLDLLSANGHLEDEISKIQKSQTYAQPAQLFWNAGADQGGFLVVPPHKVGGDLFKPMVGRGSTCADIDGDGDLDVVLTQVGGPPLLLRNDQALGHHWLRVKLVGKKANRDAIGAWVTLRAGGVTQTRQVMPTHSYLSQSELPVSFGLGNTERVDSLEITWPGGAKQAVPPPSVDRLIAVEQVSEP